MSHRTVTPRIPVPANASRFFDTPEAALGEPTAVVQLAWDPDDPYLVNVAFDESLIRHDSNYCTSVVDLQRITQLPTLAYIDEPLAYLDPDARVVDIGCGQGEFVTALRDRGIDALGFDPVLRIPTSHLVASYWTPDTDSGGDLFVMRCVLPHIERPWDFLDLIAGARPGALVLIEFQRIEWILEHLLWYQLSHDHVNVFSVDDFAARYEVVADGTFSEGEWAWVLINPATRRPPAPVDCAHLQALEEVVHERTRFLSQASEFFEPMVIWGAAGKGIVLAHALVGLGEGGVHAIDADPHRWGRYLDCSGVLVQPPESVGDWGATAAILVGNPNHLTAIQSMVRSRNVTLPRHFRTNSWSQAATRVTD